MVNELEQTDIHRCPEPERGSPCVKEAKENTELPLLTPVVQLVEEMGLDVTYVFEDLVFVEHSAFLFQFSNDQPLALYFNRDCPEKDALSLESQITARGRLKKMSIARKGTFTIRQKKDEESLEIVFFEDK